MDLRLPSWDTPRCSQVLWGVGGPTGWAGLQKEQTERGSTRILYWGRCFLAQIRETERGLTWRWLSCPVVLPITLALAVPLLSHELPSAFMLGLLLMAAKWLPLFRRHRHRAGGR